MMESLIYYHPRGDDLLALARLANGNTTEDRYTFDLTQPIRLVYTGDAYWSVRGVNVLGDVVRHSWVQGRTEGREDYRADLERCHGIEWTDDANTALDRLLTVERRRAAAKETT
jgi:hypothetical protein